MSAANEEQPERSSEPPLRRWALRISAHAEADIIAARESLGDVQGMEKADQWQERLEAEIATLATLPERHAVAAESALFPPPPLRSFPFRAFRGGSAWRVLYRLFDDPNETPIVRIVAVRHGARAPMTPEEARQIETEE